MPEQHEKTDTKISRSADTYQDGQQQHIVAQYLLHERNWRTPSLG